MSITNNATFSYHYDGVDYEETARAEILLNPSVIITKRATPTVVNKGDIVTYFVNISLNNYTGYIESQVFSDILPDGLEYVPDSLTIDTEKVAGDISNIPVNFEKGSEHLIVYQCKVL